jgi:hypothetical protein
MKLGFATLSLTGSSAAILEDDAVLLSVASVRSDFSAAARMSSLVDLAQEGSPRKAQQLLQQFAKNTLASGEGEVDPITKQKLAEIGAQLTNNTWMALEQSHRRDQDLIDKHWRAIRECGEKHLAHLQQDIDGLEVQQVRSHEADMIMCRGLPNHTNPFSALQAIPGDHMAGTAFEISEDGHRYFKHTSKMYADPNHKSLLRIKNEVCDACGKLESFLDGLNVNRPNCEPSLLKIAQDPKCTTVDESLIETDLDQWFDNLITYSELNEKKWDDLKRACDHARSEYAAKDTHCDEEQRQYETSFCSYRQGLHSTCAEYQGCHILTEEQFLALIQDVLYAADSRKIDWKAIHKISCYIKVLISDGTNNERTLALESCESGDLNTLANILTGFNESNYLTIIIPEISGNVSCWDLEVPPLIDFKECDMSSVSQFPCTETWMQRYEGLESPTGCSECAALPEHMQYSDKDYQGSTHARNTNYGGGWIFVNELGRSSEDINDLSEIQPEGYFLPNYNMKNLRWNEVLVERVSPNWCDSWGRQSSKWVEDDGASMCVQSDGDHVYCMSNHADRHTWRQQPTSHFAALCGRDGQPECECWPHEDGINNLCFTDSHPQNVEAPHHVQIHPMESDGSVVKISFKGEEKVGVLRVGNYGSFLDGVGCGAVTPVKYRVYVRCLGCSTERSDFHSKDGAQFTGPMSMTKLDKTDRATYTYEAWFRSPLEGKFRREIFGGATSGLVLVNENNAECQRYGDGNNEHTTYQLHAGNTNVYSSTCFQKGLFYHVAVTKGDQGVKMYVNGHQVAVADEFGSVGESKLARSFGGGFTDGGQLFNVRVWDYARSQMDIIEDSFVTNPDLLSTTEGLAHWWPLTENVKDIITGAALTGPEVRYAPIWCSDLEATGMRGC